MISVQHSSNNITKIKLPKKKNSMVMINNFCTYCSNFEGNPSKSTCFFTGDSVFFYFKKCVGQVMGNETFYRDGLKNAGE